MGLERQFLFAVGLEALAAQAPPLRVGIDDFGDAREALQPRGNRSLKLTSRSAVPAPSGAWA